MPKCGGVFISHITDEAPVADGLKVYLQRCFGPALPVFVSSDYVSIPTGDEWYRAILGGVMETDLFIVLLSRDSIDRRWINFEAGLAIGAKRRVVPLTIRGLASGDVGLPLSQMHLRSLRTSPRGCCPCSRGCNCFYAPEFRRSSEFHRATGAN
jgi:TIR domain